MKSSLLIAAWVGLGGFVGAILRYGISGLVQKPFLSTFPYGTLVVNLIGCLAIGLVTGLVDSRQLFSPAFRTFILIGVLGSFTTFSTFGYETFAMLRDGEVIRALGSVAIHVVLGLALVWLGYTLMSSR